MKPKRTSAVSLAVLGAFASSFTQTFAAPIDDLVGYWTFDEAISYEAANKASGPSATADLAEYVLTSADPTWMTGPLCGYVQLNGGTDEVFSISSLGSGIQGATAITLMAWFRPDSNAVAGNPRGIITSRQVTDNLGENRLYGLEHDQDRLDGRIGGLSTKSADGSVAAGSWYHAAVVYDGVNRKVYLDGVEVGSDAHSDITSITTSGEWLIGLDSAAGDRRFRGALDEVAVFNSAIDAATIASIATKNASGQPAADLAATIDPTYSNIVNPDTDSDGLCDNWEQVYFNNLNEIGSGDSDGDGLSNENEMNLHFTDPGISDTDNDGLDDNEEISGSLNPFSNEATDPLSFDTDGDGIDDGDELLDTIGSTFVTNPNSADTDGDGFDDAVEISIGSDPTDENDFPDYYANLVSYWPLDNAAGTSAVAKDGSAKVNGELVNTDGLTWTLSSGPGDGICGYADLKDTNGSYFRIDPLSGLDNANKYTIMGWVKPRSQGYRGIFMTRDVEDNFGTGRNYGLAVDGGGTRAEARFSGIPIDGTSNMSTNQWHHVAMTFNDGVRSLYVDGQLQGTSENLENTGLIDSNGWSLGCDETTDGRQINGGLDDFAVFDIDLPEAIINNVYNAGLAGNNLLTQFPNAPEASKVDDSDGDGVCDQWELDLIGNLNSTFAEGSDIDMDGLDDRVELNLDNVAGAIVTDPNDPDTDDDGVNDGDEVNGSLNTAYGNAPTNPNNPDSDADGIPDGVEMGAPGTTSNGFVTDPNSRDSDVDGVSDPNEIAAGTDPSNAASVNLPTISGTLLSYYSFDEGSGIIANDTAPAPASVAQETAGQVGAIAWDTTDPLIGAASLDMPNTGAPDTSMLVEGPFSSATTAYTISIFVYANSLGDGGRGGIINHRAKDGAGANIPSEFWGISNKSDGGSDYRLSNQGASVLPGTFQTGKWQHVAITWDGTTGTAQTYIDGVLGEERTGMPATFTALTGPWNIGDDDCCNNREFRGRMDDLAFFGNVLSAADIEALSDAGKAGYSTLEMLNGVVAPAGDIEIVSVSANVPAADDATITWNSAGGAASYNVISTTDLSLPYASWTVENANIANGGATTSFTDTGVLGGTTKKFYVIREN
ncbi:LamG domain-containing protein [Roseibacillus persicicus]|uniref:LamG domain-containing protein n=1 Tax=Roseibacillus persicicus TaxID=454148 RepID=UPI00280F6BC9|nr:LamG-like jellyroll fold domain-containing protein [Roseibacillus persicicus]MDQ8191638.1 hypothetical protein [Roseibacillus persicicus]